MKLFKARVNRISYLGQDDDGFATYTETEYTVTLRAETSAEAIKLIEQNDGITRTRVCSIKEPKER